MINRKRLIELINKEIDGVISTEDLKELKTALVEDESARKLYDQINQATRELEKCTTVEPPSDLKANVLSSIDTNKYAPQKNTGFADIAQSITAKFRAGYAWSFTSGLAVGAIVLALSLGGFSDKLNFNENQLTGTIILQDKIQGEVILDDTIDIDGVSGKIIGKTDGNIVWITLEIESTGPIDIKFDYFDGKIEPIGINNTLACLKEVTKGENSLYMKHAGIGKYNIAFEQISEEKPNISIVIISDSVIYESTLSY